MIKILVIIFSLVCSFTVSAVSVCKNCIITGIQPDPRRDGTFIWLEGDWTESDSSCSTPRTKVFFIPAGSKVESTTISVSLAAMLSGKKVGYAYGSGECIYNYEVLHYIFISN